MDWLAISIFVSTVIGVGIFFLPGYVYSLGIIPFVLLLFLSFVVLYFLGIMIYDMLEALPREENHLFKLVESFLGKKAAMVFLIFFLTAMYSFLSSYIEIFGEGFHRMFGWRKEYFGMLFYLLSSIIIFAGLRRMAYPLIVSYLFLISIVTSCSVILTLLGKYSIPLFSDKIFSKELLILGILSLFGHSILPEVYFLRRKSYKEILFFGLAVSLFLSILYSLAFSGYLGYMFPIGGSILKIFLFPKAVSLMIIFLLGISLFTSFVGVGMSLRDLLNWDLGMKKSEAILYVLLISFIFYLISGYFRVSIPNILIRISGVMVFLSMIILSISYFRGVYSKRIPKSSIKNPFIISVILIIFLFLLLIPIPK